MNTIRTIDIVIDPVIGGEEWVVTALGRPDPLGHVRANRMRDGDYEYQPLPLFAEPIDAGYDNPRTAAWSLVTHHYPDARHGACHY